MIDLPELQEKLRRALVDNPPGSEAQQGPNARRSYLLKLGMPFSLEQRRYLKGGVAIL